MRYFNRTTFAAVAAALLVMASAHAGTVISNLDETQDWTPFVTGNIWRATSFATDAQAYTLDTITVRLGSLDFMFRSVVPRLFLDASGLPSGAALETFASQNVNSFGEYTFISAGLLLNPSTTYWLVLQGQNPGQTAWVATSSTAQSGVWTIGDDMIGSLDSGSTWTESNTFVGQFSIAATPVPEPSPLVLTLAGLACAAAWRLSGAGSKIATDFGATLVPNRIAVRMEGVRTPQPWVRGADAGDQGLISRCGRCAAAPV